MVFYQKILPFYLFYFLTSFLRSFGHFPYSCHLKNRNKPSVSLTCGPSCFTNKIFVLAQNKPSQASLLCLKCFNMSVTLLAFCHGPGYIEIAYLESTSLCNNEFLSYFIEIYSFMIYIYKKAVTLRPATLQALFKQSIVRKLAAQRSI